MTRRIGEGANSLRAYPNITSAAAMLGVSPSTLSRRPDLATETRGERDRVLGPAEVLRLATIYRKRSLNDVAYDLVEHARTAAQDEVEQVEHEVEEYFAAGTSSADDRALFMLMARRLLPADLVEAVDRALEDAGEELPDVVVGGQQPSQR